MMDATIKKLPIRPQVDIGRGPGTTRPSREEAEEAVRTLIAYAGDDPTREGLRETPKRVISAYDEFFVGYHECPLDVLSRTFDEVAGYDDIVSLVFESEVYRDAMVTRVFQRYLGRRPSAVELRTSPSSVTACGSAASEAILN